MENGTGFLPAFRCLSHGPETDNRSGRTGRTGSQAAQGSANTHPRKMPRFGRQYGALQTAKKHIDSAYT
jgi:hypothetical protein